MVVLPPPDQITGDFVRNLDGAHGIVVARAGNERGRRKSAACRTSFRAAGSTNCIAGTAISSRSVCCRTGGRISRAAWRTTCFTKCEHYGKVPNANRTYYLTRSQPPFLTSIIRAVYESGAGDKDWLAAALNVAMTEYKKVWLGKERLVKIGPYELSRYCGGGNGPCPEVEPGHYDEKIQPWLSEVDSHRSASTEQPFNDATDLPLTPFRFLNEYLYCGGYADLKADGMTLDDFFKNDRALRESGHDTTHRFDDRTTDFVSVDLNSLLYKYETDFADLIETKFSGKLPGVGDESGTAKYWRQRASARKQAMLALMWDDQRGYFFDYDFVNRKRSTYISATGLYPLWAKLFDASNPAEMKRARRTAAYACEKLEEPAGLAATAKESVEAARRHDARQWDYPNGWAPHQMLAWRGFENYGLDADAGRLAYRWLYTIARNARDYNGTIPEKYDVVTGSHDVFAEYGNVGTKFDYIAPEGFGWMNASFQVGTNYLTAAQLADLEELKPPGEK